MRLLRRQDDGGLQLVGDIYGDLPQYAILSHTWGTDDQEVTFRDLENSTGQHKDGYRKLTFCAEQAKLDGLDYFWVDTCCIDKSNSTELNEAINSMFQWYQRAEKCYVFLTDVPAGNDRDIEEIPRASWKVAMRRSRWMTRGWTLQELLAPCSVEFFSAQGTKLGDRRSLETLLHEITGISVDALRGKPLVEFSINERFSWLKTRKTKRDEDRAYCMFGIFDVQLPLLYGEGEEKAMSRLRHETGKDEISSTGKQCIADLRVTDPRDDKARIEDTKGGLLQESCKWVLEAVEFRQWRDVNGQQLLWVTGDPGKGKTMLLCGIIDQLEASPSRFHGKKSLQAYFFCQATDERINSAVAVFRGLILMLLEQDNRLLCHMEKKYETHGKALFQDTNALYALYRILVDMVQDVRVGSVYIIIDALDECLSGLLPLLDMIVEASQSNARVKWLISSRNKPEIEERLASAEHRLSLEMNVRSVDAAIENYITHKVAVLAQRKKYKEKLVRQLHDFLSSHADGTFLWVALVCQELDTTPRRSTLRRAQSLPASLDALYERMLEHMQSTEEEDLCMTLLATAATAFVPLHCYEFRSLIVEHRDCVEDMELIREAIISCGSFLVIREDYVYFVHQSAKDFLISRKSDIISARTIASVHKQMLSSSLQSMSSTLSRDIYELREPGVSKAQIAQLEMDDDPLAALGYSCVHWIDHLMKISSDPTTTQESLDCVQEMADEFLRSKCLYWIESLSHLGQIPHGVASLKGLIAMELSPSLQQVAEDLLAVLQEYHSLIERYPLQIYAALLVFMPMRSLIRQLFRHEQPSWVTCHGGIREEWPDRTMTLRSQMFIPWHLSGASAQSQANRKEFWPEPAISLQRPGVSQASFSPNGRHIIAHGWGELELLQSGTGWHESTLKGVYGDFSLDGAYAATVCGNGIQIWSLIIQPREFRHLKLDSRVLVVRFSPDGTLLMSISKTGLLKIWTVSTGACKATLRTTGDRVACVTFSADGERAIVASSNGKITAWNFAPATRVTTYRLPLLQNMAERKIYFSACGENLLETYGNKITLWDVPSFKQTARLVGHVGAITAAQFSWSGDQVVSADKDGTIKIWSLHDARVTCKLTLQGHTDSITSVAFSPDGKRIICSGATIKIWNLHTQGDTIPQKPSDIPSPGGNLPTTPQDLRPVRVPTHLPDIKSLEDSMTMFSPCGRYVAHGCSLGIQIWEAATGSCVTVLDHRLPVISVAFSRDGRRIISASSRGSVEIWETITGRRQEMFWPDRQEKFCVFSADGTRIIAVYLWGIDDNCALWDSATGELLDKSTSDRLHEGSYYEDGTPDFNIAPLFSKQLARWNPYLCPSDIPEHEQEDELDLRRSDRWISFGTTPVLYLPPQYSTDIFIAFPSGRMTRVVVAAAGGGLCFLEFSLAPTERLEVSP